MSLVDLLEYLSRVFCTLFADAVLAFSAFALSSTAHYMTSDGVSCLRKPHIPAKDGIVVVVRDYKAND